MTDWLFDELIAGDYWQMPPWNGFTKPITCRIVTVNDRTKKIAYILSNQSDPMHYLLPRDEFSDRYTLRVTREVFEASAR